jgi:hypothetical protein
MSVIEFPAKPRPRTFLGDEEDEAPYEYRGRPYTRPGPNMQTFVFRSYDLIANSQTRQTWSAMLDSTSTRRRQS